MIDSNETIAYENGRDAGFSEGVEMMDELKNWVKENYKQYATGWTYQRSMGNDFDVFDDGYTSGQAWAAYEIGCILGMELEEPDEPNWEDE